MKRVGLIKVLLVVFIVVAIFNYRNESLNHYAIKTGAFIRGFSSSSVVDSKKSDIKVESEGDVKKSHDLQSQDKQKDKHDIIKITPSEDSVMANFFANVINKVLETPNGQVLLKESLNNASARNDRFSQDLEEKKYLSTDLKVGSGQNVQCGDEIEITYSIHKKLEIMKDKKNFKTKLVVGRGSLAKPLESAILGMKEGGQKRVSYFVEDHLDVKSKHSNKNNYVQFVADVVLDKIHSKSFNSKNKVRVFVNNPSKMGKRVSCGDNVKFSYQVSDMSNNVLNDKNTDSRVVLGLYKDKASPLREIYNSIVDTYRDHVRVAVILKYGQLKQLIPEVKLSKKVSDSEVIILDLYGFPSASLQDIQINSLFGGLQN